MLKALNIDTKANNGTKHGRIFRVFIVTTHDASNVLTHLEKLRQKKVPRKLDFLCALSSATSATSIPIFFRALRAEKL